MRLQEFRDQLDKMKESEVKTLGRLINFYDDIIILGNGGSSAIASHLSQDYTKQLGKRARTFSDLSRLTCYINDYGMKNAYMQYAKEFATSDTLVILISSGGESLNIREAAKYCAHAPIPYIILTGFKEDNSLRGSYAPLALLDYWVDSEDYGIVECLHQVFLHTVV